METLLQILITPAILIVMARSSSKIYLKDNKAAIMTSVVFIIMGFLIGWLVTLILNILTLGIFWAVGLGVITRTITYAILIEVIDLFRTDFDTKGFLPSLTIAIVLALSWGLIDVIF